MAVARAVLVTLVVTSSLHQEQYFLSVAFGLLFVALSDPGGEYLPRLSRTAVVGLIGALLTALGFALGGGAWGFVVLAVFAVTALSGLLVNFDLHALVAGILLNVWFLVTLSSAAGHPTGVSTHPWNQALAWLIGAATAIALITAMWLIQGRSRRPSPLPEIPADLPPIKLSRPIVLFVLIRAIAVSGAIAIAFGLQVANADWMALATLVAMKPTLQQSALRGAQRLVGTVLGAAIAAVFLVAVTSPRVLEEIIILLMGAGMSIFSVNYTFYTAAIAGAVLIALDLPHPTNLAAEGRRILFTLAGIAIAIVVMFLASLLQKRKAPAAAPQEAKTSTGKEPANGSKTSPRMQHAGAGRGTMEGVPAGSHGRITDRPAGILAGHRISRWQSEQRHRLPKLTVWVAFHRRAGPDREDRAPALPKLEHVGTANERLRPCRG